MGYEQKVKAEKYDEIVKKKIKSEIPKATMPEFSEHVLRCIKQFPINRDFKIKELYIFDIQNMRVFGKESISSQVSGGGGDEIDVLSSYR